MAKVAGTSDGANQLYSLMSSYAPFASASSNESILPPKKTTTLGYNMVLVDNKATAILDMPLPDYMTAVQEKLKGDDFWTISASVGATVARYNSSFNDLRNKSTFWQDITTDNPIYTTWHSNEYSVGYLKGDGNHYQVDGLYCLA